MRAKSAKKLAKAFGTYLCSVISSPKAQMLESTQAKGAQDSKALSADIKSRQVSDQKDTISFGDFQTKATPLMEELLGHFGALPDVTDPMYFFNLKDALTLELATLAGGDKTGNENDLCKLAEKDRPMQKLRLLANKTTDSHGVLEALKHHLDPGNYRRNPFYRR